MRYLYRSYCLKEGGIWLGAVKVMAMKNKIQTEEKATEVGN